MWGSDLFQGSQRSHSKGSEPNQFWWFSSIFKKNDQIGRGNTCGRGFWEIIHAIAFAEVRRTVCQRQLTFSYSLVMPFSWMFWYRTKQHMINTSIHIA